MNCEKTMKTSFNYSQKVVFDNKENTKNQKHTPFPKQVFYVFCFQEHKTVLENRNQIRLRLYFVTVFEKKFIFFLERKMKSRLRIK